MQHVIIFLLLLLSATASSAVTTTPSSALHLRELETMTETLRPLGYTLFCNAISTSDIQFQIISSKSPSDLYTIFAAKDPYLYALDMASDAAAYVSTLRYHVSPNRRLMISELRNLESPFLETMLPHYSILVSVRVEDDRVLRRRNVSVVRVDGVRISDPDLFVGSRIVVHGLDGILVTGIVRNDDLVDEESGLGSGSSRPPSPVGEDGVSVAAPPSSPLPPPVVDSAPVMVPVGIESSPPHVVVVEAPPTPVVIQAPPPPVVVEPSPTPVVIQAPPNVVVQTPLKPVMEPVVGNVNDDGKGLNERRRGPKHHSSQEKGGDSGKKSKEERQGAKYQPAHEKASDGGKGSKEARREKHQPAQEKGSDGGKGSKVERREKHQPHLEKAADGKGMKEMKKGSKYKPSQEKEAISGKGLKEGKRGEKHHSSQESETDGGKRLKEGRRGPKHLASQENEVDGGKGLKEEKRAKHHLSPEKDTDGRKGLKEAKRAKYHRVSHQNPRHPVTHNNRRRQTKRNRVHQKDDL